MNEMLLFCNRARRWVGAISGQMKVPWLVMVTCVGFAMVLPNAADYTVSYLPGTI